MRFPLALAFLCACSGDPARIIVNLGPDATTPVDASPAADAPEDVAVAADAQDAAAIEDAGTDVDAWVECYGDPIDAASALPLDNCLARGDTSCPGCAPYPFDCRGTEYVPRGLPLDGVRIVYVSDGGAAQWCSPTPRCVRDSDDDPSCKAAVGPNLANRTAYSCSVGADGGLAAVRPQGCETFTFGGRRVECCL